MKKRKGEKKKPWSMRNLLQMPNHRILGVMCSHSGGGQPGPPGPEVLPCRLAYLSEHQKILNLPATQGFSLL